MIVKLSLFSVESRKIEDNLGANEVLVKMLAASISPADLCQVCSLRSRPGPLFAFIPSTSIWFCCCFLH